MVIKEINETMIEMEYPLYTFHRSNQDTSLVHRPAVFPGQWVQGGDLLADCSTSVGGEISLGQNILIAYMPWEGYNFEDAILVSERLVYDDLYTSVHIEKYELDMNELKEEMEEITRDIPNVSERDLENLDDSGIIKLGSWVKEGDILIGKIKPLLKEEASSFRKFLDFILEKAPVRASDCSVRASKGLHAKVIDIKLIEAELNESETHPFLSMEDPVKQTRENGLTRKVSGPSLSFRHPDSSKNSSSAKIEQSRRKFKSNRGVKKEVLTLKNRKTVHLNPINPELDPNLNLNLGTNSTFRLPSNIERTSVLRFPKTRMTRLQSVNSLNKIQWNTFLIGTSPWKRDSLSLTLKESSSLEKNSLSLRDRIQAVRAWKSSSFLNNYNTTALSDSSIRLRNERALRDADEFEGIENSTQDDDAEYDFMEPTDSSIISLHNEFGGPTLATLGNQTMKELSWIRVYLADKRRIQVGDKMAGRHGNKGIISQILPPEDMPFLPDGTCLDIVLNPLGVPSRMNVGQIYECLLGLAGKQLGENYKIFPFDEIYGAEASRSFVYSKLYEARIKTGKRWLFNPNCPGKLRLYDGRTGDTFDQTVTVGYAYMLRLVHMVDDKIHARSTGPYALVTQQPLRGRSKEGGQRLGEMEVWALEGYGAAFVLLELLTVKSDDLTGRMGLWSNIILNEDLSIGTPESFRVLIGELRALCLDVRLFTPNPLMFRSGLRTEKMKIKERLKKRKKEFENQLKIRQQKAQDERVERRIKNEQKKEVEENKKKTEDEKQRQPAKSKKQIKREKFEEQEKRYKKNKLRPGLENTKEERQKRKERFEEEKIQLEKRKVLQAKYKEEDRANEEIRRKAERKKRAKEKIENVKRLELLKRQEKKDKRISALLKKIEFKLINE